MDTGIAAIERCAYCRDWVPITVVEVAPSDDAISAAVAVCEECRTDGR
ncbi:hypothetical protein NGM10_15680 (plasmid) [Halorussus salilacus]|nr:hypothetical protein [Halorussus salilacus]USZ69845.1 hypothetical protein NGM10_15680 [Halorussus salilacus]